MTLNPVDHKANKHVKINCHYIRELTSNNTIVPVKVPSDQNLADMFTKALAAPLFQRFSKLVVSPFPSTATILMFTKAKVVEKSSFMDDWPYVTKVQQELGVE
jgi:hypothetical protein